MQDILLDSNYDILTEDGDFLIGESTVQHQQLLLVCNKGDFKENPAICVGVARWLKDDDKMGVLGEIKKEFEKDGMTVRKVSLTKDDKLNIDAGY